MKIFKILFIIIWFVACGNIEKEKSIEDDYFEVPPAAVAEGVPIIEEVPDIDKIREEADHYIWSPEWIEVVYSPSLISGFYKVKYALFYNENFPNGYVIIKEISITSEKEKVYRVVESITPAVYIALVDRGIKAITIEELSADGLQVVVSSTSLINCSSEVVSYFRTAEAIIMASYNNPGFTEKDVKLAGERMEGRVSGVPR